MKLSEYVTQVINDPKYGHDAEWVRLNLRREHLERIEAAHDAEVLRAAATELEDSIHHLNPAHPGELSFINCTRIDARLLRDRADRTEVRAGVVAEEPAWEYGIRAEGDDEPYTDHSDDPDWLCDQITPEPGDAIVRRRKAGPWAPVKQEAGPTDG